MLESKGFYAWITIDGVELEVHKMKTSENGEDVSGWIASEVGKKFRMNWKDSAIVTRLRSNHVTSGRVKVDGIECGGTITHAGQSKSRSTVFASATTQRPLVFAPLQCTEDDTIGVTSGKDIGEISLSIWRVKLKGERRRKWKASTQLLPPQEEKVHEQSKKAFAHRVGFGEESTKTEYLQGSVRLDKNPVVTFRFLYRPLDFLYAQGIINRPVPVKSESPTRAATNNPDLVESDTEEMRLLKEKLALSQEKIACQQEKLALEQQKLELDQEKLLFYQEKLDAIQKKRPLEASTSKVMVKRVKNESKAVFLPGEVIDLT